VAPNDHDEKYQRYIDRKINEQGYAKATFKTPEQWAAAIEFWKRAKDKGDRFRDGMTVLRNQTPSYGYDTEVHVRSPEGRRYQDARHLDSGHSSEYKAGAVTRDNALKQLNKDVLELRAGRSVDWTVVRDARIHKDVQARMAQLQRDYPEQFRVYVVSQQVARLALTIGKHKEKERQREKLARQKEAKELAARERERLAPKRLAERRAELVKEAKVMQQALVAAEQEGVTLAPQKLAAAEKNLRRRDLRIERQGAKQAEKLVTGLGLSEAQTREMQEHLAEKRAEKTEPVREAIARIGAKAREVDAAEKKEAQERELTLERDRAFYQEQARARAAREASGLDPEFLRVLDAVESASHVAPSKEMSREERESIRRLKTQEVDSRGLHRGLER
jgi:hypothetical protein